MFVRSHSYSDVSRGGVRPLRRAGSVEGRARFMSHRRTTVVATTAAT